MSRLIKFSHLFVKHKILIQKNDEWLASCHFWDELKGKTSLIIVGFVTYFLTQLPFKHYKQNLLD